MKSWFQAGFTAAATLLAAFGVEAQPATREADPARAGAPVEVRLEMRKVVAAADGKETFAGAEAAKPGDVIEYTATYRNTGRTAVTSLSPLLPIPGNTEFLPGSQKPAAASASLDGKAFAPLPLTRKVERNGASMEVPVPVGEIRALRWTVAELGSGQATTVVARVRVLDDRSTGPPPASPPGVGK